MKDTWLAKVMPDYRDTMPKNQNWRKKSLEEYPRISI